MAKGFKHGAGGSPLNFKVVAYISEEDLKATTPKENTIGIVTTNKITSWTFSFDKPTEPTEGMVWFAMGFNSIAEFNILKKNSIKGYPLYAQQYVSGAWVDVTAMIYQSGDWVKWVADLLLYSQGDENTDVTGGFTSYKTDGTITKESNNIYLNLQYTDIGVTKHCFVYTAKKIDLTHYRAIRVKYSCSDNDLTGKKIFIAGSSPTDAIASSGISRAATVATLDISNITGEHYVCVGMTTNQNYNAYAHLRVTEIRLER